MEKVVGVSATTKRKHDLEVQETRRIKITHRYSLKEKKLDIEAQKIALEKEVQQRQLALQEREMALREFEAGIRPGYLAPDFSFGPSKSSSHKRSPRTVYLKSSTPIRAPSSLSQSSQIQDISPPSPVQSPPRKTRSPSWDISEHEFDAVQDTQKSPSASPKPSTEYKLLGETGISTTPYFLDK